MSVTEQMCADRVRNVARRKVRVVFFCHARISVTELSAMAAIATPFYACRLTREEVAV